MEANRDAADNCKRKGMLYLRNNDGDQALKWFSKAKRLHPGIQGIDGLIAKAMHLQSGQHNKGSSNNTGSSSSTQNPNNMRQRNTTSNATRASTTSSSSNSNANSGTPSPEVQNIINCKEHYQLLGVTKDCSGIQLKKAYKKMALKYHPDKNTSPGADEAFKAISNAFTVLNDAEQRAHYDRFGVDNGGGGGVNRGGHSHGFGQDGEISPEDLFNMFFGGGMPAGMAGGRGGPFGPGVRVRHFNTGGNNYRRHRENENREPVSLMKQLVQLLPLLFFIFLSIVSNYSSTSANTSTTNRGSTTSSSNSRTYPQHQQQQRYNNGNKATKTKEKVDTRTYKKNSNDDSFFCSSSASTCVSPVQVIGSEHAFEEEVVNSKDGYLYIVQIFDRDTMEAKPLKKSFRQWEKLANGFKGAAKVIAVDESKLPQLYSKYNMNPEISPVLIFSSRFANSPLQYTGDMKLKELYPFMDPFVPHQNISFITSTPSKKSTRDLYDSFISNEKSPGDQNGKVVIVDNVLSKSARLYYKAISNRLGGHLSFAQGHFADSFLVETIISDKRRLNLFTKQHGNDFKPLLVLRAKNGKKWITYDGKMNFDSLCQWLVEQGELGGSSNDLCK